MAQTEGGTRVSIPDAELPTAVGSPWVIRYSVDDAAGNAAEVVLREVVITCPEVSGVLHALSGPVCLPSKCKNHLI